jgi:hypothetical protein
MAAMRDPRDFRIDIAWESAPGVATPEYRATWALLTLSFESNIVTAVEDTRGAYRRSVHTSAYPLAEWIAFNWWFLTAELRPSALPVSVWKWSNVANHEWLRRHNMRGAGAGMPWPDLTFVCEGAITRAVWHAGPGLAGQPVTFLSNGDSYLRTSQFIDELSHFVDEVVDRLREAEVFDTPLAKEWQALREADEEEAAFARAAARLGLDPYGMSSEAQEGLISVAEILDPPLMDEFLDSAVPEQLGIALNWLEQARSRVANYTESQNGNIIAAWRRALEKRQGFSEDRPWNRGYAAAREVRSMLGLEPTESLSMDHVVPKVTLGGQSAGLEGFTRFSPTDQLVVVLPAGKRLPTAVRFAQARSLGLVLASDRDEHLLDPASSDLSKESRAFAAELLAPIAGITQYLSTLPAVTDAAFDAVAARFRTSSLLVRLQYENQGTALS